jgi:hypothetical protein
MSTKLDNDPTIRRGIITVDLHVMVLANPVDQALRIANHPVFHILELDVILGGHYVDLVAAL